MEAKTVYMLGQHCSSEPCSSLILSDLEGGFGVGGMPAFELRIKMNKIKSGVPQGEVWRELGQGAGGLGEPHCLREVLLSM